MTTTDPAPTSAGLSIEEAAQIVADWIAPAREAFASGQPVHLTFSPGEGTAYALSFVPAGQASLVTEREYPRVSADQALLVMPVAGKAVVIAPDGQPYPSFVAEKLKTENVPTILAVGLCWWLMVGNDAPGFARAYGPWLDRERYNPLPEWKRSMLDGGAWLPASGLPLARADLTMALSAYEEHTPTIEQEAPHAAVLLRAVRALLGIEPS